MSRFIQTEPCNKKKYLDRPTAYAAGKGLIHKYQGEGRFDARLSVYQCLICGYWHLTRSPYSNDTIKNRIDPNLIQYPFKHEPRRKK